MKSVTSLALLAILCASILTAWVPERWPVAILEIGGFVLFELWVVRLAWRGERPNRDPVLAAPVLILLWGALQMACGWTVASSETARAMVGHAANLAILFAGLQTFGDRRARERFLDGLLWFAFLLSFAAILQAFTSNGKVFWLFAVNDPVHFMGPFLYHNHFAAFVEAVLPLALIPAVEDASKRLWYAFVTAILVAAVIVSASRSGVAIIAMEVALVIAVREWRSRHRVRRMLPAAAVVLLMTVAVAATAGWESLSSRLSEQDPYFDRMQMLRSSVDMIRDHAWTGVGLGNWPTAFPYYARHDDGKFANQAHNDWAQSAAESGMVGLVAFGFLFAMAVRRGFRNVWGLGVVCVFVQAFADYPFQKPQIAAVVFALLAAGAAEGE